MQRSTVKWFDAKKGYGFLQHPEDGEDVFVHYSQILSVEDFKTLRTGQEVEFEISDGPKGLHALDVKPVGVDDEDLSKKADTEPEAHTKDSSESTSSSAPSADEAPAGEDLQAEATPVQQEEEEEENEWEEDWTDEYGNPPDPMAGPTF